MIRIKPPWWCCNDWWSPWCVLDTALHKVGLTVRPICDRHDARIMADG